MHRWAPILLYEWQAAGAAVEGGREYSSSETNPSSKVRATGQKRRTFQSQPSELSEQEETVIISAEKKSNEKTNVLLLM